MGRHREIFSQAFEFIQFCDILFFFLFLFIFRRLSDFSYFFLSQSLVLSLSCLRNNDFAETWFQFES